MIGSHTSLRQFLRKRSDRQGQLRPLCEMLQQPAATSSIQQFPKTLFQSNSVWLLCSSESSLGAAAVGHRGLMLVWWHHPCVFNFYEGHSMPWGTCQHECIKAHKHQKLVERAVCVFNPALKRWDGWKGWWKEFGLRHLRSWSSYFIFDLRSRSWENNLTTRLN